jgi:hypothetical protein
MITFMCVHCNEELNVPDHTAGKRGKCPHCGKIVHIPTPAQPLDAVLDPEPATFAVAPVPAPPPAVPPPPAPPPSTPFPSAVGTTPSPEFRVPPPAPGPAPSPPVLEPAPAYPPPAEQPAAGPVTGSVFTLPGMEMAVGSILLGLGAMLLSANCLLFLAVAVTRFTLFLWWLSVTGVGAFGILLAVLGLKAPRPRGAPGFWYLLVGLVLNGVALLLALIVFLVILAAPDLGQQPRFNRPPF